MKVCIAEKPSVAKEIALILGAKKKHNGYFEGNGYQVTWTFGHLCTLKEPQDYQDNLKFWNLNTLPIVPLKFGIKLIENRGVEEQFNTIKRLVNSCDEIINCGDAGQEGELIQRWVLQLSECNKPISRLWISSLTEEAIRKGFENLQPHSNYDKLFYAGSSRAIGDWLLGINATRLYTLKYGAKGLVLSIGRVQTPTLAMIVDRHKEIDTFVTKPYWELKTLYRNVKFSSVKGKITDEKNANEELALVKDKPFKISSFEKKEGKEGVPKLFDLTSLQVECNKKLSLGADETLKIAQTLYERKHITYPRVDTRYLPNDIYPTIKGILNSLTNYKDLVNPLLEEPIKKPNAVFNDKKITDHHAIIPTNVPPNNLGHQEMAVYDIIVKRFIANFYPECKVSKTTVIGESNNKKFRATGKQILDLGWRVVYGKEKTEEDENKKEDDNNQVLPDFQEGETGNHEPFLESKQTTPPKPFTEATLLRAMETAGKQVDNEEMRELMKENGIGRPSTRANIIQTLYKRQYIKKNRKTLIATQTGIQLIDTIKNDILKSAELTGSWEKNLRNIEEGTYDVRLFMKEMKTMVMNLVREVKYNKDDTIITLEAKTPKKRSSAVKITTDTLCPKCKKGNIIEGKTAYGCSSYKEGCDFLIPFIFEKKQLSKKQLEPLIVKGKTGLIKDLSENKNGYLTLDKNYKPYFLQKKDTVLNCPKCNKGTLLKGKSAYGCSKYKHGCTFTIPFTLGSLTLKESHIKQLTSKSKTTLIKNIKLKSGDTTEGYLNLNKDFKIAFTPKG